MTPILTFLLRVEKNIMVTKIQKQKFLANAMKELLLASSPGTTATKKDFLEVIDYRIYVNFHSFNTASVSSHLAKLGFHGDSGRKDISSMEHHQFLDLIAQAINLKILTTEQLPLITKWHPQLESISDVYGDNHYLLNVYRPLAAFAIEELAKIGIPAKIMETQPVNEGDHVLLTFDYTKAFDFSKLIPAMLSMRKQVAEQTFQFNDERLTGAEFLGKRKFGSITGLKWGFTKQELQSFSDFISQFDPEATLVENATPHDAIKVIFKSGSGEEKFELAMEKLGLRFNTRNSISYSISVMSVYKLIHSYNGLKNNPLLNTHDILPIIDSYLDEPKPSIFGFTDTKKTPGTLEVIDSMRTKELIKIGLFPQPQAVTPLLEGSKASDNDDFRPEM